MLIFWRVSILEKMVIKKKVVYEYMLAGLPACYINMKRTM